MSRHWFGPKCPNCGRADTLVKLEMRVIGYPVVGDMEADEYGCLGEPLLDGKKYWQANPLVVWDLLETLRSKAWRAESGAEFASSVADLGHEDSLITLIHVFAHTKCTTTDELFNWLLQIDRA